MIDRKRFLFFCFLKKNLTFSLICHQANKGLYTRTINKYFKRVCIATQLLSGIEEGKNKKKTKTNENFPLLLLVLLLPLPLPLPCAESELNRRFQMPLFLIPFLIRCTVKFYLYFSLWKEIFFSFKNRTTLIKCLVIGFACVCVCVCLKKRGKEIAREKKYWN